MTSDPWSQCLKRWVGGVLLSVLCLSASAQAEWYVAGQVGKTFPSSLSSLEGVPGAGNNAGATLSKLTMNSANALGGKLGYYSEEYPWLGLEAEYVRTTLGLPSQPFTHQRAGTTTPGTLASSDFRVTTWAMNLMLRYPGETLQPYLGLGVGLLTPSSDNATSPGLNLSTGLRVMLMKHVAAFGEWKYNRATLDVRDPTDSSRLFSGTYSAHTLMAGLSLHASFADWGSSAESSSTRCVSCEQFDRGVEIVIDDATALATAPLRMTQQDVLMGVGALAAVGGAFALDHPIRTLAQQNTTSRGQDLASGISAVGSVQGLAAFNAVAVGVGLFQESSGQPSRLKQAGLVGLESEGFVLVATGALKVLAGRSRPDQDRGLTSFRPFSMDDSFVSTHTAASFAVASVFADRFDAPVGYVAYGLATAVAASRIYKDVHFTSDVVAGGLVGWGIGYFLSRRHLDGPTAWRIAPLALEQGARTGQGQPVVTGLQIGRSF